MLMIGDRPAPTAERPFHRNDVAEEAEVRHPGSMAQLVFLLTHGLRALLRDRADLALENLALRQQVAVLAERRPRPRLSTTDRLFWVFLRRLWSRWADVLVVVQPDTVVRWHRLGFRLLWRWRSRPGRPGRPRIDSELRDLIRQMARENPTWGAPRIHGELLMLGFDIAERTVSRYMPRRPAPGDVVERWKVFLRNHQEAIVGMDFFTVPTATFDILYVLVFVHHARRRVVHLAVTKWPTAAWVVQQLREAFPFDEGPRFLIFDRDAKFSTAVVAAIRSFGIQPSQTA
jgi:putative transposase